MERHSRSVIFSSFSSSFTVLDQYETVLLVCWVVFVPEHTQLVHCVRRCLQCTEVPCMIARGLSVSSIYSFSTHLHVFRRLPTKTTLVGPWTDFCSAVPSLVWNCGWIVGICYKIRGTAIFRSEWLGFEVFGWRGMLNSISQVWQGRWREQDTYYFQQNLKPVVIKRATPALHSSVKTQWRSFRCC